LIKAMERSERDETNAVAMKELPKGTEEVRKEIGKKLSVGEGDDLFFTSTRYEMVTLFTCITLRIVSARTFGKGMQMLRPRQYCGQGYKEDIEE